MIGKSVGVGVGVGVEVPGGVWLGDADGDVEATEVPGSLGAQAASARKAMAAMAMSVDFMRAPVVGESLRRIVAVGVRGRRRAEALRLVWAARSRTRGARAITGALWGLRTSLVASSGMDRDGCPKLRLAVGRWCRGGRRR